MRLFAGGSGATFTLGVLDDLVGCATLPLGVGARECGRRGWCGVGMYGGTINWFAPYLLHIATRAALPGWPIKLSIRVYVRCLCGPDAVLAVPGVRRHGGAAARGRHARGVLGGGAADEDKGKRNVERERERREAACEGCAGCGRGERRLARGGHARGRRGGDRAGPDGLIREARNAVARANLAARGRRPSGAVLCAEAFTV
ncbi:hypothetical protein DFH09DRAFT_459618 [Mycena vulgaris]|nr:hypothetical protein DFH09DRAFT_459618 [Mycena vulgaris]